MTGLPKRRKITLQERIKNLQQHKPTFLANAEKVSASHLKQLTAQEDELQFSRSCLSSALTFSYQLLSSFSTTTDLVIMSKQVYSQLQALTQLQPNQELRKTLTLLLGLLKTDPLSSQIIYTFVC